MAPPKVRAKPAPYVGAIVIVMLEKRLCPGVVLAVLADDMCRVQVFEAPSSCSSFHRAPWSAVPAPRAWSWPVVPKGDG